ncbi:MAG: trypsin-like peptidase domain-containing protein [Bacteroidota bacterium]
MRSFQFLVFVLIANITIAQDLPKLYKEVSSSVVVLRAEVLAPSSSEGSFYMVEEVSQGSGVLVSEEGHIWTAAHVVQSAEEVEIEFVTGEVYQGEVVASSPPGDVALLKIVGSFDPEGKAVATIGDSDALGIGEDVFVLGAPHGFAQTLSRGILSGRHFPESLSNDFEQIEFLQTDAAINPGNSGGPMFNKKGEVIGIASSIYTISGGFEGIGFVTASNTVKQLLTTEPNPWTGMEAMLLPERLARVLNVPQETGLLVLSISSKGSAAQLGLRGGYIPAVINDEEILLGGDVILEVAGVKFVDNNAPFLIRKKIASYPSGTEIPIVILREGQIGKASFPKP